MHTYALLSLAIVAEVIATSFLKASEGFTRPLLVTASFLGYGLSFYFLAQVLESIPVGVAYAIWSGVGIALITIIGVVVFGQKLDAYAYLGLGLIVAGVAVLNLLSSSVETG